MVESNWARAAHRFSKWYSQIDETQFWFPPRLRTRECMFQMWSSNLFDRHINFDAPRNVLNYLHQRGPKSCFYSTAYYGKPLERKMADKEWKGADLIFDLDGDHLDHVDPFNFPEMLEIIQLQTHNLWEEFLSTEFGFKEEYLHVTFSGHRGFHLHYRDPNILGLDSSARRELVNHIRGEGVEVSALMNNSGQGGWKTRLEDGTINILNKLDIANQDGSEGNKMTKELCDIIELRSKSPSSQVSKCGPTKMKTLAEKVQHPQRRETILSGNYNVLGGVKNQYAHLFLELVKGDRSLIVGKAGETDEAVTVDIKRQIRWPNSLNGKCGLKVVTLPLDRLHPEETNAFDALSEALPRFDDKTRELEIVVERCVLRLGGDEKEFSQGDTLVAESNIDTFLTLKGWAKPI
jgi:DNA primase small subunit